MLGAEFWKDKAKSQKIINASLPAPHGWQEAIHAAIAFLKIQYGYSYG